MKTITTLAQKPLARNLWTSSSPGYTSLSRHLFILIESIQTPFAVSLYTLVHSLVLSAAFISSAWAEPYQQEALLPLDGRMPVFYEALKTKMDFPLGWYPGVKNIAEWHQQAYTKAAQYILPYSDATPFNATVIAEEDRGTYWARQVVWSISAESRVLGLLLVPKATGPHPAAVMLHDHGGYFAIGKEKMVKPFRNSPRGADAQRWADTYFSGHFPGDDLAKRGFVVFSFDALGWGDRSAPGYRVPSQQALAANLLHMGISYAGLIAVEDKRAAAFVASLPMVDPHKIAAVGFSMGAYRSWQLAAMSNDISASIVVNWLATMKGLMVPENHQTQGASAYTMLHPFLGRYLDYPDVAGLAAPKPMLVYAGAKDKLFSPEDVREAIDKMRSIWAAYGAADRLRFRLWPHGHVFYKAQQTHAFDWLIAEFTRKRTKLSR